MKWVRVVRGGPGTSLGCCQTLQYDPEGWPPCFGSPRDQRAIFICLLVAMGLCIIMPERSWGGGLPLSTLSPSLTCPLAGDTFSLQSQPSACLTQGYPVSKHHDYFTTPLSAVCPQGREVWPPSSTPMNSPSRLGARGKPSQVKRSY